MPPAGQGGWGGGGGGGNGGGVVRRGGVRGGGAAVQGREEIRKFLNFYRRKNSVCVDLYQPAFYAKKPNWEDMAEFVYSVLSVGGKSSPQLIRAAVRDVQLHTVKKLLFMKLTGKGLISPKKLPGCTNGIWTVKLILEENKLLPPFLIRNEEGEVWQLATGDISVCCKTDTYYY